MKIQGKPIPESAKRVLEEANIQCGKTYAHNARSATKILVRKPPMETLTKEFTIRKIMLPSGKVDLALFVNGEPWKYQPHVLDSTKESHANYVLTHDIFCHPLIARDRTYLPTDPIGEISTGHFNFVKTLFPIIPWQYDGLVSNIAEHKVKNERGRSPFYCLQDIVSKFRRNSNIQVGSELRLRFRLPPPDITWNRLPNVGSKSYIGVSTYSHYEDRIISPGEANELLKSIKSSPNKYEFDDLSSYDPKTQVFLKKYRYTSLEPYQNTALYPFYFFLFDKDDNLIQAEKYFQSSSGEPLSVTEAILRLEGLEPIFEDDEKRYYLVQRDDNKWEFSEFSIGINKGNNSNMRYFLSGRSGNIVSVNDRYEAVYTGYPYQEPSFEDYEVVLPVKNLEIESVFNKLFLSFDGAFKDYQTFREEAYGNGTLPLDFPVMQNGGTFLKFWEEVSEYKPEQELGLLQIQRDIYNASHRLTNSVIAAPAFKELYKDQEFYIHPFPPPPYKVS